MKANRMVTATALCTAALVLSAATAAADIQRGKALHDENCMKCHGTEVYTRENRRINSLAALRSQVTRCEMSQELRWSDEQAEDVVQYLNETFYKFE